MKNPGSSAGRRRRFGGFSLVEVLVASSMAAVFLGVAVVAYDAIVANKRQPYSSGRVDVGVGNLQNFFGASAPQDDLGNAVGFRVIPWAPNYAKSGELDLLRDAFMDDVGTASAVFCLSRVGLNTYRPTTIPLSLGVDARMVDTPEAFANVANVAAGSAVFTPFRGRPPATARNGSVFVLRPSPTPTRLAVGAIWDIDLVPTTSPPGTYVAIRRYQGTSLTLPFEIFYPADENTQDFSPLFASFERRARKVQPEVAYDKFKKAANRPFFFMWWPDPADAYLEPFPVGSAPTFNTSTDPRADYRNMSGRTSFFFVVPMFPAL